MSSLGMRSAGFAAAVRKTATSFAVESSPDLLRRYACDMPRTMMASARALAAPVPTVKRRLLFATRDVGLTSRSSE